MRTALILLALLAAAFAGVLVWGSLKLEAASGDGEDVRPPPVLQGLARAGEPFTPRLELPPAVHLSAGGEASRRAPAADKEVRMLRLRLVSGRAAVAGYACVDMRGRACPQTVCLCVPGARLDAAAFGACHDDWLDPRRSGNVVVCRSGDEKASLAIYAEGGDVRLAAPAGPAVVDTR